MLVRNAEQVLAELKASDVVVDIGGWAQPFTRANYVVDLMPYETRGIFGRIGPDHESFTKDTWLKVDICTDPLPFADKSVDYLICSHTLEDIRDPIHLCREINRVAKAGYIEVPSRRMEAIWGLEHPGYAGYYHHHWLVEFESSMVTFRFKTPLMSSSWRFRLPKSFLKKLSPDARVSWLFWRGDFQFREVVQLSEDKVAAELEQFVRSCDAYPAWRYGLEKLRPDLRQRTKRFLKRSQRLRPLANRLLGRQIATDEEALWNSLPDHHSK